MYMAQVNYQSKTQAFIEKYAPLAIEYQQKYGIPASVTLAQGIIESANGESRLAKTANNFFGVKGTFNGAYVLANDDKPNEKFKKYDNVSQSFEDHAKVLMAARYQKYVGSLSSDDYVEWAKGIKAGGYATSPKYVNTIVSTIEGNDLHKYDLMAIEDAKKKGVSIGYMRGQTVSSNNTMNVTATNVQFVPNPDCRFHFPVDCSTNGEYKDMLVVTSGFGPRKQPGPGASTWHNGLDLRANYQPIYATEDNGKVITVASDSKSGKYIRVEYERSNGTKYIVSYGHLSDQKVKVGDTVNAGDMLGTSGQTGIKGTGAHLHFVVRQVDTKGNSNYIDPTKYLAEISVKGGISTPLVMKGDSRHTDTLAQYKSSVDLNVQPVIPEGQQNMYAKNEHELDIQLTDQQLKNAATGATAGVDPNNPMSLFQLLFGQNGSNQWFRDTGGDLFSSLISSLFMAAIGLSMGAKKGNGQDVASAEQQANKPETQEQHNATLLKRQRDSVDPEKLREMAMMDFDASYPEHREERGQRIT